MAHIITDSPASTGWQCPACRHVYGPQVSECPRCPESPFSPALPVPVDSPEDEAALREKTGRRRKLRESYTFSSFPPWPDHRNCKCSLAPCPPPPGGGMCGCDGDDATPVLRLPAHMAHPGCVQIAFTGADWAEVLPGLQAVSGPPGDDGKAVAYFRLTPPDGQDHD
jgi:hypothetical protein